jgi:hypothetical protein
VEFVTATWASHPRGPFAPKASVGYTHIERVRFSGTQHAHGSENVLFGQGRHQAVALAGRRVRVAPRTIQKQALALRFPVEELRKYEGLFRGTGPDGSVPPRTGKVILVKPSIWSVYREGNRASTRMTDRSRAKAGNEVEPPRLDDNLFSLPSELRASSPDEVDTVILCEYGQTPWDPYQGTGLRLISVDEETTP